jgi:hypothetical protein
VGEERVLSLTAKLRAAGVPLWMDVAGIDGAAMMQGQQAPRLSAGRRACP